MTSQEFQVSGPQPQPILMPLTEAAIFLVITVDSGGEDTVLDLLPDVAGLTRSVGFRSTDGGLSCVVGIADGLWDRLFDRPKPRGLHPFREVAGRRHLPGQVRGQVRARRVEGPNRQRLLIRRRKHTGERCKRSTVPLHTADHDPVRAQRTEQGKDRRVGQGRPNQHRPNQRPGSGDSGKMMPENHPAIGRNKIFTVVLDQRGSGPLTFGCARVVRATRARSRR